MLPDQYGTACAQEGIDAGITIRVLDGSRAKRARKAA
jgi:hypothetical protein